jgi:hypothetical protein
LIWIARVVLGVATFFTIAFDPRLFFGRGDGGGNWISFTSWFYGGSWWAFRLSAVALVLYGIVALVADGEHRVGWRGPGLSVLLLLWALARGVPHRENMNQWSKGEVGALAWIRAERAARDRAPRPISATTFAGLWRASDGSAWRFGPNDATRTEETGVPSSPAAKRALCTGTYRAAYEERGRDVLVESGLDASVHGGEVWHAMPERIRLPVAGVACSEEPWAGSFVLVRDDEIWLLEAWMTADEIRADAFVFRRVGGTD